MQPSQNESGYENETLENADYDEGTADNFYDEQGNYRSDAFLSLGSHHYMNYLHAHDDML